MLVKETKVLNDILGRINKAIQFLEKDEIVIAMKSSSQYSDSFIRKNGEVLNELTKFIGSDLMQLKNAQMELKNLIEPEKN